MLGFYKKPKDFLRLRVNTDDLHTTRNSDMTAYISITTPGQTLAFSSDVGVSEDFEV